MCVGGTSGLVLEGALVFVLKEFCCHKTPAAMNGAD